MIKILKQGNPNRKVKVFYQKECMTCGCIFEYENEDIETNIYKDKSIECPCCKRHLGISEDDNKRFEYEYKESEDD